MIALLSLGVMRIVLAPAAIMFSIAVTWPALSPSVLPAPDRSLAPCVCAAAAAPSFIFTKKGLVSVLVIRPTTGWSAARGVAGGGGWCRQRPPGRRRARRASVAWSLLVWVSVACVDGGG